MQQVEQESIIAAWLRVSIFETFLSLTPGKILKIHFLTPKTRP
jgi:hypothetical protein